MHAGSQMHPYPGRNRRCGQKSNKANASVKYELQVKRNVMSEERLGFHAASAYNYSGEREVCKVAIVASGAAWTDPSLLRGEGSGKESGCVICALAVVRD